MNNNDESVCLLTTKSSRSRLAPPPSPHSPSMTRRTFEYLFRHPFDDVVEARARRYAVGPRVPLLEEAKIMREDEDKARGVTTTRRRLRLKLVRGEAKGRDAEREKGRGRRDLGAFLTARSPPLFPPDPPWVVTGRARVAEASDRDIVADVSGEEHGRCAGQDDGD